jgi:hypothetical protein
MAFILNEDDIDFAADRGVPGARVLQAFKNMVNENSDGWPYWRLATNASVALQKLVQSGTADAPAIAKALVPIKSFCTRKGLPQDWIGRVR